MNKKREGTAYVFPKRQCEDCDKIVANRIINYRWNQKPYPHWKESCTGCNMWKSPDTGKFDSCNASVRSIINKEFIDNDK